MPKSSDKPKGLKARREKRLRIILRTVQKDLEDSYGIKVKRRASRWYTTDTKKVDKRLREQGGRVNPRASTLTVRKRGTEKITSCIIYLNPKILKNLYKHNPLEEVTNENYEDFLTVIEEVSHFVYTWYYYGKYKKLSEGCVTELVGAIDKYYELQRHMMRTEGRIMDLDEEETVMDEIIGANEEHALGLSPGEYAIGHRLAQEYINYLNAQWNRGKSIDNEIHRFYEMENKDKIEYLLWKRKLAFHTYGEEKEDVERIFDRIGVKVLVR
jgi:hypothetical protein